MGKNMNNVAANSKNKEDMNMSKNRVLTMEDIDDTRNAYLEEKEKHPYLEKWYVMTENDILFYKYGYGMPRKLWEEYEKTEPESKELHWAFAGALEQEKEVYSRKDTVFVICGVTGWDGHGREMFGRVITSDVTHLMFVDGEPYIHTRSGSTYRLDGENNDLHRMRDFFEGKEGDDPTAAIEKFFEEPHAA